MRHRFKAILVTAVAVAGTLAGLVISTSPALAWQTGNCKKDVAGSPGVLCYYYQANYSGAREGIADADANLSTGNIVYQFTDNGTAGVGDPVYRDAHSAVNDRNDCKANMYSGTNYTGAVLTFSPCCATGQDPPYQRGDLSALDNANESQNFCQ